MRAHRGHWRRRGVGYVLVLGVALFVSLVGVTALLALRVRLRGAEDLRDVFAARNEALAGVECAVQKIADTANWRTSLGNGWWFRDQVIGNGKFSVLAADPTDADVTAGVCDNLELTAYGQCGRARQIYRVTLTADANGFDPLYDTIMARSPLTYWRLGDATSTAAADVCGHRAGVYRNGVAVGRAVPNRCDDDAKFDGADDYVEIPHCDDFMLAKGTIGLWFNTDNASRQQGLISKDSDGYDTGGHFYMELSGGTINVRLQSTSASYTVSGGSISAGAWHFAAFSFGGSGMVLFVDGVQQATRNYTYGLVPPSGTGNRQPFAIGVNTRYAGDLTTTGWDCPFAGEIDEVFIVPSQLGAGDIQAIYTAGTQTPPHTMTLLIDSWRPVTE